MRLSAEAILKPEHTLTDPKFREVELQIASWCNRSCTFCPSGDFTVEKKIMSREVLESVVGHLRDIEYDGTVSFHLMCEPLLAEDELMWALEYIREKLPGVFLRVETNGDIIKDYGIVARLLEHGLNDMLINCYESEEQFDARNKEIRALVRRSPSIWYWNKMRKDPQGEKNKWQVVKLRAFYGSGYTLKNWAGVVETSRREELEFPLRLFCYRPFHKLHVNYLGQVLLCNMDWKFEVVVGDLITQSLGQAWNSEKILEYRRRLLEKDRAMHLCRNCDNGIAMTVAPTCPPVDVWGRLNDFITGKLRL